MGKIKPKKTIIKGMNFLERALLEIHPSTERFIYRLTPNEIFNEELGELPISKPDYVKLYESWSDTDKAHLIGIFLLLNKDVTVHFKPGKDEVGEYGIFSVDNATETYVMKIYGPSNFSIRPNLTLFKRHFIHAWV